MFASLKIRKPAFALNNLTDHLTDHDLDHVDPNLLLLYVVQDGDISALLKVLDHELQWESMICATCARCETVSPPPLVPSLSWCSLGVLRAVDRTREKAHKVSSRSIPLRYLCGRKYKARLDMNMNIKNCPSFDTDLVF